MKQIILSAPTGKSLIQIGGELSDAAGPLLAKRTVFLVDENVYNYYSPNFNGQPVIKINSGESSKSMEYSTHIFRELLNMEVDRSWSVIGVGGGITTDLTGFVASTFLRGLPFGFISTTLLGQVDAAIGGKNGINLDGYKNMIGIIKQPVFVFCDIYSLGTLPESEFLGGFSEIIKYGAIRDSRFFEFLEKEIENGTGRDGRTLETIVFESVRNKVEVVTRDEKEEGERKTLNFGHTFAHAIEKLYKIPHGQAVAMGMTLAGRLSVNLGLLAQKELDRLENLIYRSKLSGLPPMDADLLIDTMKMDKKRRGDEISLILLENIGRAVIREIKIKSIKSIVHDLC